MSLKSSAELQLIRNKRQDILAENERISRQIQDKKT